MQIRILHAVQGTVTNINVMLWVRKKEEHGILMKEIWPPLPSLIPVSRTPAIWVSTVQKQVYFLLVIMDPRRTMQGHYSTVCRRKSNNLSTHQKGMSYVHGALYVVFKRMDDSHIQQLETTSRKYCWVKKKKKRQNVEQHVECTFIHVKFKERHTGSSKFPHTQTISRRVQKTWWRWSSLEGKWVYKGQKGWKDKSLITSTLLLLEICHIWLEKNDLKQYMEKGSVNQQ